VGSLGARISGSGSFFLHILFESESKYMYIYRYLCIDIYMSIYIDIYG